MDDLIIPNSKAPLGDSVFGTPNLSETPSMAATQSPARYFNNKEIEDFFGIDYKEMEKIVS
jgi:hypothetical protein